MKLYITHASGYDYKTELYEPLKQSIGQTHDIFYPHDEHSEGVKSKDVIPTCDAVLAEVSFPSTGQGIELGWADADNVPIVCFYKQGAKVSGALGFIARDMFAYESTEDMIAQIGEWLELRDAEQPQQ